MVKNITVGILCCVGLVLLAGLYVFPQPEFLVFKKVLWVVLGVVTLAAGAGVWFGNLWALLLEKLCAVCAIGFFGFYAIRGILWWGRAISVYYPYGTVGNSDLELRSLLVSLAGFFVSIAVSWVLSTKALTYDMVKVRK